MQTEIALGRKLVKGRLLLQLGKRSRLSKSSKRSLRRDDTLTRKAFRERLEMQRRKARQYKTWWKGCKDELSEEQAKAEEQKLKFVELRE